MKQNGFTLVEMLIALSIFGMLAAGAVAVLSLSVRTQETADAVLAELGELRRADALLAADLGQAVPRPTRDERGDPRPAFAGGTADDLVLLALVRGGWDNPGQVARPSLQRVEYRLAEGRLERLAFPALDGGGVPVAVPLVDGVRALRMRYRDRDGEWRERWDPTDPAQLPRAVELVIEADGHGTIRQLFLVGAAR